MKITEHFSLEEFACRDGSKYPTKWIQPRLRLLCAQLEIIRAACGGRPIEVTSGYRTPEYNRKIGGARRSQHVEGRAADIKISGMAPAAVHGLILDLYRADKLQIGGLGAYGSFTHVDTRPGDRLARWSGSRTSS